MSFHLHDLDGAQLIFDRATGSNLLRRDETTRELRRQAPRCLQIALSSDCNLDCSFCYRDRSVPQRLDSEFLIPLLREAAEWGVLEVALGGGEPLLVPGLADLVGRIREGAGLAVNLTTNGLLLDEAMVGALDQVSEIRLSAYASNGYRRTLGLLRGRPVGVNWLVTPATVGLLEPFVFDFLDRGARNVLLLGYMGEDQSLRLGPDHIAQLQSSLRRLEGLPIRTHACWYPWLPEVPHLFQRSDCGAGDEFLVLTPDRCVQACSFSGSKQPFESIDDLERVYRDLRERKPAAEIGGCTRQEFPVAAPVPQGLFLWEGFSSNNSGDWTIVGRFRTRELAEKAARALRELARAHEAFLASPDGQEWLEKNDYYGCIPSEPLRHFGQAHGFDWSGDDDGLWWEEDGCGAPVLTAGAVGDAVVVYHEYCMGLPEEPFRRFFQQVGGVEMGYWQYGRPFVEISCRGGNEILQRQLEQYFELIDDAEYPSDVEEDPPWGAECSDPRVFDDENRSARLDEGPHSLEAAPEQLRLKLRFENMFAGSVAVCTWLSDNGFSEVEVKVEQVLAPLARGDGEVVEPRTGLFATGVPISERISTMAPAELIKEGLEYLDLPSSLEEALRGMDPEDVCAIGFDIWRREYRSKPRALESAAGLIGIAGRGCANWAREVWQAAIGADVEFHWSGLRAIHAGLDEDEAFDLASRWYGEADTEIEKKLRLGKLWVLECERVLDLVEDYWEAEPAGESAAEHWTTLCAKSRMSWPRIRAWIERGRPFSLIALSVLAQYAKQEAPESWSPPSREELAAVFKKSEADDDAARAMSCRRDVRIRLKRLGVE